MSKNKNESGPFETILAIAGLITGAMLGYEQGEWMGAILGATVLGGIGKWVGTLTDNLIKIIFFVAIILLNAALRQFLWGLIREILNMT